jgi:Outer membrane protein beta-barrel domain
MYSLKCKPADKEVGMTRRGIRAAVVALGLGLAGTAMAQDKQGDVNVFLGGGIGGYTGDLGGLSATGPTWGATLNIQPYKMLGFEVGYEGSKNDVTDDRFRADEAPSFLRHGVNSLVKLSPPVEKVRPFVGAGLGVSYVYLRGNGEGLFDSDFMEQVPLSAGLEFNAGALTAGVRGTYRVLVDDNFADAAVEGDASGGLLDANITVGGRF